MRDLMIFRPFKLYAQFAGRSARAEYWAFVSLIYGVYAIFLWALTASAFKGGPFDLEPFLESYLRFTPWFNLFNLAVLLPFLAVSARRLHDTGQSAWWLAMPMIATLFGYILFFLFKGIEFIQVLVQTANALPKAGEPPLSDLERLRLELPLYRLILPWSILPGLFAQLYIFYLCLKPSEPTDNRFGQHPHAA